MNIPVEKSVRKGRRYSFSAKYDFDRWNL